MAQRRRVFAAKRECEALARQMEYLQVPRQLAEHCAARCGAVQPAFDAQAPPVLPAAEYLRPRPAQSEIHRPRLSRLALALRSVAAWHRALPALWAATAAREQPALARRQRREVKVVKEPVERRFF